MNLRSTRETELAESYPLHVVCAWIGNSQPVAAKHYLQVTDEHFERAAQNAAQQSAEMPRNQSQAKSEDEEKTPVFPAFATNCGGLQKRRLPTTGLEPYASDAVETAVSPTAGAKCGALTGDSGLDRVIEMWHELSGNVRREIVALAEASAGDES